MIPKLPKVRSKRDFFHSWVGAGSVIPSPTNVHPQRASATCILNVHPQRASSTCILNTDYTHPVDFNTTPATPCTVLET